MLILLSRTYVVPTGFILVGLLALSAPIPAAGVLLLCAVVGATAAMITFALRSGPTEAHVLPEGLDASRQNQAPDAKRRERPRRMRPGG